MFETTTITQKWQMTIPRRIRQELGITKPGKARVRVVKRGKTKEPLLKIEKDKTDDAWASFMKLGGILHDRHLALEKKWGVRLMWLSCVIASLKPLREKKAILVTYDRDFKKLDVISKTPDEAIQML